MTSQECFAGARVPLVGLELREGRPNASGLAPAEVVEIRHANRQVRSFMARCAGHSRGAEARDVLGRPVDPVHPEARSFSIVGAFLAAVRPSPWLFRRWMAAAHAAAGEIWDDAQADVFAYNDAPEIDQQGLAALLDEIDARVTPFVIVSRSPSAGPSR